MVRRLIGPPKGVPMVSNVRAILTIWSGAYGERSQLQVSLSCGFAHFDGSSAIGRR